MNKFKVGDKVEDELFGEGIVVEEQDDELLIQFKKKSCLLHNGSAGINGPYKSNTCFWYKKNTNKLKILKNYTYEDLKKCPVGTKITFEKGNIFLKFDKEKFINLSAIRSIEWLSNLNDNFGQLGKIIKIEEPTYKTVYKAKPEILDEEEKRYLRGVIRPFKNKVKGIEKKEVNEKEEYIYIFLGGITNNFYLPSFEKETMYKGMQIDNRYSLEELGL